MATKKKHPGTRRVTFKKVDFERFAKKMEGWSTSLSPEERALLVAALNKGSQGIRKAGGGTVQTTSSCPPMLAARASICSMLRPW
jgi:hypothetical protein